MSLAIKTEGGAGGLGSWEMRKGIGKREPSNGGDQKYGKERARFRNHGKKVHVVDSGRAARLFSNENDSKPLEAVQGVRRDGRKKPFSVCF